MPDSPPLPPSPPRAHLKALLIFIGVILLVHAPTVFAGKSLNPALIQPHGLKDGRPYGYSGRVPVNVFNVDMPTEAYYEWPVNKTIGDIYKKGEFPLWNPYQAGGTPLLADYSTRALFPYQVLEDVSPSITWDLFLLGRMLVAGFFTYLFLSIAGLSFNGALLGGLLYMLSGVFGWFLTLEQLSNVAMTLPVLMALTEYLIKRRGMRETAFAGFGVALTVLAGQPEAALYSLLLWSLYIIFRTIGLYRSEGGMILSLYVKSAAALAIGLLLSSPLILPFIENVSGSYNLHPGGFDVGVEYVENWKKVFGVFTPTVTEVPADPSILPGALAAFKGVSGEVSYYRTFATKGAWDYLGGYTGVIAVFLAFCGAVSAIRRKGAGSTAITPSLPPSLFFLAFALSIVLKNFGVKPFLWLGHLPLFDRAWSPRWSSPSWIFALSSAGAIGYEALSLEIKKHEEGRRTPLSALIPFLLILAFFLITLLPSAVSITLARGEVFEPPVKDYVIPSILLGSVTATLSLMASFIVIYYSFKKGSSQALAALIPLAALELWWDMPRGYGAPYLYLKAIPFSAGFAGALIYAGKRRYASYALALLFFASFLWIDTKSPYGLPERYDPFTEPPYVNFLKERTGEYRAAGGYGVLVPNYAGSIGLKDLHYINALVDPAFLEFRREGLQAPLPNEEKVGTALWFTGLPQRITVNYSPEKGMYYGFVEQGFDRDISEKLPNYSLMGVKYLLVPSGIDLTETKVAGGVGGGGVKLIYDKEIRIYENTGVMPRAFVLPEEALDDALGLPELYKGAQAGKGPPVIEASIKEYRTNSVTIEANVKEPGLLVLSDVFTPGWKALVNGKEAEIIPVNGFMRGVYVKEGANTVVFRYSPGGVGAGVALFGAGAVISIFMISSKRRGG